MKKVLLSKSLPLMLLGGLLLAGLITIFLQADTYGISRDEPIQVHLMPTCPNMEGFSMPLSPQYSTHFPLQTTGRYARSSQH